MMTWQEIESAPRNGEHILVSNGSQIFMAYGYHEDEGWRDAMSSITIVLFTPTHWMPLPELPQ